MERIFCFLYALFVFGSLEAQQDRFYSPYNGLSNTSFNAVIQDKSGFLWIATNGGLNRFDGYNFKVYRHNPVDTNSFDIDIVYSVFIDSKNTMWVGTERGLYSYNRNLDNFSRFPLLFNNAPLEIQVNTILEDKSKNLWLGTSYGLVKIDSNTQQTHFLGPDITNSKTLTRNLLNSIILDKQGCLWMATDKNGLFHYNPAINKFTNYRYENNANSVCDNSILSLGIDGKDNVIIGTTKGGISVFNPKTGLFRTIHYSHSHYNLFNSGVYSILTDKEGITWVGTERNGLKTLDTETCELKDANSLINVENISDSKIHIYHDFQGNLWFTIDYEGIYLKKRSNKPFHIIQKKGHTINGLSNNIVKSILVDSKDNLWVGTDGGGLNYFPRKGNTSKVFVTNPKDPSSIPDNAVISLFEDNTQNLWIGTYLGGLSLYDRKTDKFSTYLIDPLKKGRDYNYVTSIIPDGSGNLWVATNGGGLNHFDCKTRTFKSFQNLTITNGTIALPLFLTGLLLDKKNNLWLASYNGLYRWNEKESTYESFTLSNNKLESDAVYSLLEDGDGTIWFGTASGLYCYLPQNKSLSRYNTQDGLPNNSVLGISEDAKGNLWLSTLDGLSKFDKKSKLFRNYYTYDGLPGNEFRPSSCFKGKNGMIYFGSTSGLVYFNPDSIQVTTQFPTITFSNFKIFNNIIPIGKMHDGRTILRKSINESNEITIRYADNNFTIEFAAIDYNAPEKIRYAYTMEGFDQKWIERNYDQRFATYTNLNPGTYVFKLTSTNSDGSWSNAYKTLTIHIAPPIWRTWWAYLFYFSLLVFSLLMIRKLALFRINMENKLKMERLEREKLEEFNQSKLQFFSNVSHEFRTPLTMILGPVERLSHAKMDGVQKKQIEFIHKNTLRLLRLVNLLLDLQKVEKNEMRLKTRLGDIIAFSKEVTFAFEELAQHKKIELSFNADAKKLDVWFDHDKLDKVLFNLLSNAIKFTPKGGKISVEITTVSSSAQEAPLDSHVNITVTDTGKGIKEEYLQKIFERFYQIESAESEMQLGTGIGLHLSKYLIDIHRGKLTVTSKEGEGTRFDILIPLKDNYLLPEEKSEDTLGNEPGLQPQPASQQTEEAVVNTKENGKTKKGAKKKILLVEDDHEIRDYIKSELVEKYDVLEAADGVDGWEMAQDKIPDLIVSDVMMPLMDGIQLCKKVKTDLNTSHIPVILLTARTSIENRIEGLESGADSYIPKPFNPKHLTVRIEKLLELRQNLLNKFSKSINFEAKEMTLTSADERFLQKAINLVKENISNSDLNIEDMGTELGMSRVHLYRKLKALTNQTPSEFVRTIRLKQAAYLLTQNKINISEVAYTVGFSSHQYFTNCFQNYFSMSPTEYSHQHQETSKNKASGTIKAE